MTRLKAAADRTEARTVLKAKVKSKGNHGFSRIDTDKNEAGRKCRSLRFAAEAEAPVGMTRLKAAADRTEARTVLKAKVKSKGNHGFSRIDTDKNEAGRKCRSLDSLRSLGMTNQRERSGGSGRDDKIEGSRGSHGGADSPQGKSQKQRQPRIFTDRHGQERGRKKMQVPRLAPLARDDKSKRVKQRLRSGWKG